MSEMRFEVLARIDIKRNFNQLPKKLQLIDFLRKSYTMNASRLREPAEASSLVSVFAFAPTD